MAESTAEKREGGEEEKGVAVLDFDVLCATVALQTRGFSGERGRGDEEGDEWEAEFGGVQRMWEGDVLDCLENRRIAVEAACCPCYRFGKNLRRANLGPCFLQGTIYFMIIVSVLCSYIAFIVTKRHSFLLMGIASTISFGLYTGYFRTRIRKQFNIMISGSGGNLIALDDCMYHQICPCCTLCQESRTLETNNVQGGVWHGRGDVHTHVPAAAAASFRQGGRRSNAVSSFSLLPTKSPELCNMERAPSNGSLLHHPWNVLLITHSEPLV